MPVTGAGKGTVTELRAAAEEAIKSIGFGYDVTVDLRLKYGKKKGGQLITIEYDRKVRDLAIPGGVLVRNVSKSIRCDKGERLRFSSVVLSFHKMSEQFNQELSLAGKIPLGYFNTAFEFSSCWQKDAANAKTLAFEGVFITLYSIVLQKSQIALMDHVRKAVPSLWDPAALARFIERFGTHIIVGVKMGGKDIVYVKQLHSSTLEPADVKKRLKQLSSKRFSYDPRQLDIKDHGPLSVGTGTTTSHSPHEDITFIPKRRRGNNHKSLSHEKWCQTVHLEPDVISMSFIPISSLLSRIDGSGFLSHAINLYLRYKPPIEELYQFLEFQHPKQWAPIFGELALGPDRKHQSKASVQFSFMGPKLYVNTNLVDVGNRPVTGLRLYLEGKRNNCLAVHLQHISSLPKSFQLQNDLKADVQTSYDRRYYEKVKWKSFSHTCTAPVESDDVLSIVTGAHFEVKTFGLKRVLLLRLHFCKVIGATVVKQPEWDGTQSLIQKSGIFSTLMSTPFSTAIKPPPKPSDIHINSALYPGGPPVPVHAPKLLRFVDTSEITRGPQDTPGYWVVCGARLMVNKGKISLRVKYALLTVILPDEDTQSN